MTREKAKSSQEDAVLDSRMKRRGMFAAVARRKDIAGERLAMVAIPPEPILPSPCVSDTRKHM
jgi:hypothetical protein